MSDALDTVRDERANGRLSPAVVEVLDDLSARVARLEEPAPDAVPASDTATGGE